MFKKNSLSLKGKVLGLVLMTSILVAAIAIIGFLYFYKKELVGGIINKQRTIHIQLDAAKDYVATQGGLEGAVKDLRAKYEDPGQISKQEKEELLKQVPIVAAMSIGRANQKRDYYKFRIYSREPRNEKNMAGSEQVKIIEKFETDPKLEEIVIQNNGMITMYRPVRLSEKDGCLHCHGDPAKSIWGNGEDILGYKMENWVDGKLHGVFAVSQSIEDVKAASVMNSLFNLPPEFFLIFFIVLGAVVTFLISGLIAGKLITEIKSVATNIWKSEKEVLEISDASAKSAFQISNLTSEQASSLQQTSASIEEISAMVGQNAKTAEDVRKVVEENSKATAQGTNSVLKIQESISDIKNANSSAFKQMEVSTNEFKEVLQIISDISEKTQIINDIVFQTKLLSFNASVEAARAGEQGKGFAVVAEEVGSLAELSGNAAKAINELLISSTDRVNSIVESSSKSVDDLIKTGHEKISIGEKTSKKSFEILKEIETNAQRITKMIEDVALASQEQSQGIDEVNQAISAIDKATHQNAVVAKDSQTQSEKLTESASGLADAVEKLNEIIDGKKH